MKKNPPTETKSNDEITTMMRVELLTLFDSTIVNWPIVDNAPVPGVNVAPFASAQAANLAETSAIAMILACESEYVPL